MAGVPQVIQAQPLPWFRDGFSLTDDPTVSGTPTLPFSLSGPITGEAAEVGCAAEIDVKALMAPGRPLGRFANATTVVSGRARRPLVSG
jgi:hypothetical protein